jgi:HD-GYP domain-containing protein (c-di-GMP phosphodiesterase class II)
MHFKRVPCDDPEVAVVGISGSLGPRARPYLTRLTDECRQRNLQRVVLDLSRVGSLGGGTAQLLNEFAAERDALGLHTSFVVVSPIVRSFLCRDPDTQPLVFTNLEEAAAAIGQKVESQNADDDQAPAQFVEEISWDAAEGIPCGLSDQPAPARNVPDEDKVRVAIVSALRQRKLASRVHVLSLQADGHYHPVTPTGIDLERGIPADGVLANSVLQHDGPMLLFDVCNEPLSDSEEDLVTVLNCEVVSCFESHGAPEMLLFLSKEQSGDEYTPDELEQLRSALREVSTPAPSPGAGATPERDATAIPLEQFTPEQLLVDESEMSAFDLVTQQPVDPEHERALRRKVAKLREVLRLGRGFDATFGSSRILDVLVLSLVSLTRSQSVLYFGERADEFHLTHHRGLDPRALPQMLLHRESSLAIAALESESAVRIAGSNRVTDEEKMWARQRQFQYIMPFRSKDDVRGLLILGGAELIDVDLEMLTYLLHEAALAYDRAHLYETLEDRTLGVVRGLMTLIESRTTHDAGSTENVVRYAQALAREIQFPEAHVRDLVYGTVLRDVGMLRVEQNVLNQTGQLSADEWEDVRRHTIDGAAIMRQMRFKDVAVEVVLHHHEAYNGEGYPAKLRGRAIPLGARIVAVAEAYVKMTMDRPYRKALGRVEALESLAENWGLRYDPLIVDALVRVVNRELSIGLEGDADFANHLYGV